VPFLDVLFAFVGAGSHATVIWDGIVGIGSVTVAGVVRMVSGVDIHRTVGVAAIGRRGETRRQMTSKAGRAGMA